MASRNPITAAARAALERLVASALRPFGLAVGPRTVVERGGRLSYREALEHAKRVGLDPGTVIDVGVAAGTWPLYDAFPNARILLIEPVAEAEPDLRAIAARYPRVEYVLAAAAARPGRVELHVHPDTARTSAYWESDYVAGSVTRREVSAVTLDALARERGLDGPYLLKLDVQGAELDVLEGAGEVLQATDYVILESCLFQFFDGAPLVADVVAFMQARGFVLYDFLSIHYRPLDGAVSTADLAFVQESGRFRRTHRFQWDPLG